MFRNCLAGAVVLALCVVVWAEEFGASISKVDGDKVTFKKRGKDIKDAKDETLPVAKDCKVNKGKFDFKTKKVEVGDAIEGGLKNEMFTKIGEKGQSCRITTSDDGKTITAITTFTFGKVKAKGGAE